MRKAQKTGKKKQKQKTPHQTLETHPAEQ